MLNELDILSFIEHGFHQDEFLKLVSHELRTPLAGLQLEAQSFKRLATKNSAEAYTKARVDRLVETIEGQSRELSSLINTMLDLTRLRSSNFHLEFKKINFTQLLMEIASPYQLDVNAKSHWVMGDEERLREAIGFQIGQFFKQHHQSGIKLKAMTRKDKVHLAVTAKEAKMGIDPDKQSQFDFIRGIPLKQLKDSTFKCHLSYEMIRLHKGTFKVGNDGLKISLPLAEA